MELKPIKTKARALSAALECKPQTRLEGVTFSELVKAYGKPVLDTSDNPGSGGRRRLLNTCYRFVFDFEGEPVTCNDWRNPSLDFVEHSLTRWVIGASSRIVAEDAVNEIKANVKKPTPKKRKAKKDLVEFENAPASVT